MSNNKKKVSNTRKRTTNKRSTTNNKKVVKASITSNIDLDKLYDTGVVDLPKKKGSKKSSSDLSRVEKYSDKVEPIKKEQPVVESKPIINKEPTLKKTKKINILLVFFVCIMYMEVLFSIVTFGINSLVSTKIIYTVLFTIILSLIFGFICKIGNKKINKILSIIIMLLLGLYYFGSYLFKSLFNTFFSFHLLGISDQAATFIGDAVMEILKRLPILLLFLIPFIFLIILKNRLSFRKKLRNNIIQIIGLVLTICLFMVSINISVEKKQLFNEIDNNAMNIEKLGLNVSTYLDIKRMFVPVEEKIDTSNNIVEEFTEKEKSYGPNSVDIDFDSLIANSNNKTVKEMHEYFKNQQPTYKNEYTGIYEGKNLVVVMGESLNDIAISEKYTPTLYKLSHEGFEFTNFYTPINMSTLGGEFQMQTGLFANLAMLTNKFRPGTTYFPYGLGKVFNDREYYVSAYHANTYSFQSRDKYLKSLGYDKYIAKGTGLEKLMNCNIWPQSDYDMVNATIDDILAHDKFMAYYVSVSGHMPWGLSANAMSARNKAAVADLKAGDEAKGYVAANIELDKALELIIKKLEEANKLDDTVIAVVPDHYPYSMNINSINELSSYQRDERFEVNHSSLIIWNNKQEHKKIDKITNSLDFIPTLLNLFNVEYDSRLITGKDIFAPNEGLVFFTDRSWISDKGRYNAATGKFIPSTDEEIPADYVKNMNSVVSSRINTSKLIMEYDYYRTVLGK